MDYAPNIAAVEWIIDEVMPVLRRRYARARFHIVGRAAPARLKTRHGESGTRVWGEVPDVRPYLEAADIVVAPLLLARGVQNKVLEAMAMARPVLLTPSAATGIDAVDGMHFRTCAPDPALWARAIADLFDDRAARQEMGEAARHYVMENMSWDSVYRDLAAIVSPQAKNRNAA